LAADDSLVHEICVPLHDIGMVVGIVNVESAAERPLTDDDFQLLLGVAELVSASITRGRLYAEVRDKERLPGCATVARRCRRQGAPGRHQPLGPATPGRGAPGTGTGRARGARFAALSTRGRDRRERAPPRIGDPV
jgi:GAF domain-containing protein